MPRKIAIRVDPDDNVLVALTDIKSSEEIEPGLITKELIPAKQKLAGKDFNDGDDITMYGVVVGSTKNQYDPGHLLALKILHTSLPLMKGRTLRQVGIYQTFQNTQIKH